MFFDVFFSTTDFRNAFLKTIRQIIRESVRNMSIPSTKHNLGAQPAMTIGRMTTSHVEKYDKIQLQGQGANGIPKSKSMKHQFIVSSHAAKRKYGHPKHPEAESSEDKDEEYHPEGAAQPSAFRSRSKTIGDSSKFQTYLLFQYQSLPSKMLNQKN